MKLLEVLLRRSIDQLPKIVNKLLLIFVFTLTSCLLSGQGLDAELTMADGLSVLNIINDKESFADPAKIIIPTDLDIINLIGSCEFSNLDYTLDTLGLTYEIIENEDSRYFVDIEGSDSNIKSWEIATEPAAQNKEKVTYVLVRYYHDNMGDLTDFDRYETKRYKKINERKFTYNKSVGRSQSYIAVQIDN